MPKVNVDVNSKYSAEETYKRIQGLFGEGSDLKKMDSSMTCTFDDAKLSAAAKGKQFSADLKVSPQGSNSNVSIEVDLPMLMGMFKGQIKSTIEHKLNKLLA
ncbi:MAG: polyhydroxyalkanoic acid system family protein [Bdellovibrionales bacterium]|nr:polyhydroxyalkanoic acid system family protein [Bdellovibrionales bacterium]